MASLATILVEAARAYPDRPAVRLDDQVLPYAEFDDLTSRAAAWLRGRGVATGDRVGVMLPNVLQFPVLYFGALRVGAVVVPMNPLLKGREVRHYLGDSGARLVCAWSTAAAEAAAGADAASSECVPVDDDTLREIAGSPALAEVTPRSDHDTAVILYTSGTTGTPKGAELTHANMSRNATVFATTLVELGPDDVVMGCLPLSTASARPAG
jgi:long-chain acyl-CoA synthetase